MSDLKIQRRLLGVDFGNARIGLAVSDELRMLAHPLETISATQGKPLERIARIVDEKQIERVIVGLPRNMNGTTGEAATNVLSFVKDLRGKVSCEVLTWDERLTTVAANRALQESGRNARNSRPVIDQVAAQIILQSYLDSSDR